MTSTARRTIAASLTLLPAATAVAATTVQAEAPTGLVDGALPAIPDLTSLQGCTAYFGLTKDNSVPMVIAETVEGPLTPAPTLGNGITPVATITLDDASVVTCILEKAWTDETSFRDFHSPDGAPIGTDFTVYPGANVYLIPGYGVGQANVWSRWFVGWPDKADNVDIEFVVDEQYLPDFTVTGSATLVPFTDLDGFSSDVFTGSEEMLTYLRGLLRPMLSTTAQSELDALTGGFFSCSDPDAPTLEAELLALIPVSGDTLTPSNTCELLPVVLVSGVLPLQLENNTVDVLVQSEAPTTTATPTTEDDGILSPTIPTTGADDSARHTAVGAGLMAALGAALVMITRRRRTA
jgi:hypothetical protein